MTITPMTTAYDAAACGVLIESECLLCGFRASARSLAVLWDHQAAHAVVEHPDEPGNSWALRMRATRRPPSPVSEEQ